jgi:hypothetical protein
VIRRGSAPAEIDRSGRYSGYNTTQLCSASHAYFDGASVSDDL